jgi:hypothetical protein
MISSIRSGNAATRHTLRERAGMSLERRVAAGEPITQTPRLALTPV